MSQEVNVNLNENPKLFIQVNGKEIFVSLNSSGEIRVSLDNANVAILPNGSNSFYLELRD